uniref:Uncharacterized LOC114480056 n=2 Tax=Gouania willdenowi TaxID=441366 RepID=A0A8C5EI32_GOUWI
MALSALEVSPHAVSMLARLNLQRKRDEFCDCVLRQKDNPDQVFPAHRCVLAASSPVFASILSSSGVLVDLQDPWLPDSLPSLLDYIYTGDLPYIKSQQQYHSLFTAACYLQVEELREALRAWKHPVVEAGESTANQQDITQIHKSGDLPLVAITDAPRGVDEIVHSSVQSYGGLPVSMFRHHTALLEALDEDKIRKSSMKDPETYRNSCESGLKHWSETDECKMKQEGEKLTKAAERGRRSPRVCSEAVPVIRHSSTAANLCLAPSGSSQRDSSAESIITQHKFHYGKHSQVISDDIKFNVTPSHEGALQDICYKPRVDLSRCSRSSSFGHSPNIHIYSDSLQSSTKPPRDYFVLQNNKSELPFLKAEKHPQKVRLDIEPQSDSVPEVHPLEGDVEEEHSDSLGCAAELNVQESKTNTSGPSASVLHKSDLDITDTAVDIKQHTVVATLGPSPRKITGCLSSFKCYSSPEPEEITETRLTFPMPTEQHMSDQAVSQSYSGHVQYHCLTEEMHKGCDKEHIDYSNASSNEEEEGAFSQQFATGSSDQVVLLDISTKPSEHHVSRGRSLKRRATTEVQDGIEIDIKGKFQAKSSVGASSKLDKTTNMKDQSRSEEEVIEKVSVVGTVSNSISRGTVSSSVIVSDSLHTSMSSISSVCTSPSSSFSSSSTCLAVNTAAVCPSVSHPFQCHLCVRSFSQRGSLNRHVRSHLGVRPFPCPHCPMTFSRQYRVVEHMRVHQRCVLRNDFQMTSDSLI